jgi:hypothetical protein
MLARRDGRQLRFLCVAIEPAADPRELNGGVEAAGDEVGGRFGFEFVLGVRESRLAAVEHERWSHWQRYLHDQCAHAEDGSLIIPRELAERWTRQATTDYIDLSETEKSSDREQVREYLRVLARHLD